MLLAEKELTLDPKPLAEPLDLLDRQPFVDQLVNIANMLADKNKNACYAINGGWGVGKTYVLDMFEKQIRDYGQAGTTLDKFLVFHYNCWQYDYYDEPLIAIVSAMMDAIDDELCLLPTETKEKIKVALREIAKDFLSGTNDLIKTKTGLDVKKLLTFHETVQDNANREIADARSFDTYFDFKKKLHRLKETIVTLSIDQTVVIVVDELDRCLPEYAIKVLERLHHVFDDIPNIQLILSVDKVRLENTISQIYGDKTSVENYLAKFIDFEVKLSEGTVKDNFARRFPDYVKNFEILWKETKAIDIEQFTSRLLEGIGMRKRIALVNKCQIIHEMISATGTMDTSFMCIELFLSLLKDCRLNTEKAKQSFSEANLFVDSRGSKLPLLETLTAGLKSISDHYLLTFQPHQENYLHRDPNYDRTYISCRDLWGIILGVYRRVIGFENDRWTSTTQNQGFIMEHVLKFWDMLQIIN